ncbi:hypothetical protein G6F46_004267 [Rhizopus delemar]|uniref:Uncharacterized protein n=2 Tax=Rhizopus TaxID=4842 RepID=A0A9P6YYT3_9FUNG|nr:hypothetical protein G6F55_007861 [Rhizopus delemar]KAG1538291.1 hypothetical protein G6F51_009858 [Rhizopus arrhizus]KAG1504920.1 hypothetical protein G6F54_000678 [Rhizopus delemar]KAG1513711.1 hypothetical protein G6F53_004231 [Rhizopus delemar]KAG1521722.1 hypothetical protein G6F52_006484 [Rhizopus delemar]
MWRTRSDVDRIQWNDVQFTHTDGVPDSVWLHICQPKETNAKSIQRGVIQEEDLCFVCNLFRFMELTNQYRQHLAEIIPCFWGVFGDDTKHIRCGQQQVQRAVMLGVPMDQVKDHANWSLDSNTFEKFYYRPPRRRLRNNDAQIVDFINYVYRPEIESSPDSLYKLNYVYDKEILGIVWTFTKKFDKTTPLAFTQWLNRQNVDFLSNEPERKTVKGNTESKKIRRRHLNVLDNSYYVDLAKNIIDVIPRHHAYINQLKKDGYHIIGYYRKSKSPNKVFVSPYSNVKQDLNDKDTLLSELDQVNGDTEAFIQNNDKVCVVALDYAGFTTNMSDLKSILRQ